MSKAASALAWILLGTALFTSRAHALQIQVFDRMSAKDQQDYIYLLMRGAEKVLVDAGRKDDAAKVHKLFNDIKPGSQLPLGEAEFELNFANARAADAKLHVNHPDEPRLEIEDVLAATLDKNGIDVPDSFFTVGSNFKPSRKPQQKKR